MSLDHSSMDGMTLVDGTSMDVDEGDHDGMVVVAAAAVNASNAMDVVEIVGVEIVDNY